MPVLNLLEKLINEHGSSAILKERLGLVATEYAALERRADDLQAKNNAQEAELQQLRAQVQQLQASQSAHGKFVCDHCGSPGIVRVGSRPDPVFGDLGAKLAIYRCSQCNKETTVAQNP